MHWNDPLAFLYGTSAFLSVTYVFSAILYCVRYILRFSAYMDARADALELSAILQPDQIASFERLSTILNGEKIEFGAISEVSSNDAAGVLKGIIKT